MFEALDRVILLALALVFRRRKRRVGGGWRMDEGYVKVGGRWKYLYRAIDRDGRTADLPAQGPS